MNKTAQAYLLYFFIFMVTLPSCTTKKVENTIPEKDFVSILTDSYLADGLLTVPSIREKFSKRDSVTNYMDIVKSHGYTWEQMQNTLDAYFTGNPKKLSKIYDQILSTLSQMESQASVAQQIKLNADAEKQKTKFHFILPDSAVHDMPSFSYNINGPGTFTLLYSVTLYPTDQSLDPCFMAWIMPSEKGKTEIKVTSLPSVRYIRDGKPHEYSVKGKVDFTGPAVFYGYYLTRRNNPAWTDLYADIHNLNFNFIGKQAE